MRFAFRFRPVILAAALLWPAAAQANVHLTIDLAGTVSPGAQGYVFPYLGETTETTSFAGQPIFISLGITRQQGTAYVDSFTATWSNQTYTLPYLTGWAGVGAANTPENESFLGFFSIVDLDSDGGHISLFPTNEFHSVYDAAFDLTLDYAFSSPHDPFSTFNDAITGGGAFDALLTFVFDDVVGPYDAGAYGSFTLTSLSHTAAVPEPSTWIVMILGFGAVGLAARRRALATA